MSEAAQYPVKRQVFPHRLKRDIFSFHNEGAMACSAIVSEAGRLAYVPIPKNACSSLKMFFYELIKGEKFSGNFSQIHGKFPYTAIDFNQFAADRDHFKFVVVRDPLQRFVSAYNNRIGGYRELSKDWFRRTNPKPKQMFEKFENRGLAFNPSIGEFAQRMEDYIDLVSNIRHHFQPQHCFLHNRPEVFDRVYNIRALPALAGDIAQRIGRAVEFPKVQETNGTSVSASLRDLTAAERTKVETYYQEDFRLLDRYF